MRTDIAAERYFLCNGKAVKYADLYKYPGAHIIGHLTVLSDEDRKVTALALWEKSSPTSTVPPVEPDVRVYLVGDARRVKCTQCCRKERWEMGKAAFLALMARIFDERMSDGRKETA